MFNLKAGETAQQTVKQIKHLAAAKRTDNFYPGVFTLVSTK